MVLSFLPMISQGKYINILFCCNAESHWITWCLGLYLEFFDTQNFCIQNKSDIYTVQLKYLAEKVSVWNQLKVLVMFSVFWLAYIKMLKAF